MLVYQRVFYLGLCDACDVVGIPSWSAEVHQIVEAKNRFRDIRACKDRDVTSRAIVGDVSYST